VGDCPSDDAEIAGGASELFVIRLVFELNVWQRTALGAVLSEARRRKDSVSIHHHDGRESDPSVTRRLSRGRSSAWLGREGGRGPAIRLLLVADGQGDATTRADSYRLMRRARCPERPSFWKGTPAAGTSVARTGIGKPMPNAIAPGFASRTQNSCAELA